MDEVIVKDKLFKKYIDSEDIMAAVKACAKKINNYYKDYKDPVVFVSILNGAAFFTVDLMKELNIQCECEFIKASSYHSTGSTGVVKELIGLKRSIEGRDVIIIDDIVDSGVTMLHIKDAFIKMSPKSLKTAAFIYKPKAVKVDITPDFYAIEMLDNPFIIGYGLDYDELGRNLKDIYIISEPDFV